MEAMTPWLLLIIAALIVACVSLYYHLRQVESQSRGEQSIITDELREAEAALTSALEKIQRMDRELAARERALSDPAPAEANAPRTGGGNRAVGIAETDSFAGRKELALPPSTGGSAGTGRRAGPERRRSTRRSEPQRSRPYGRDLTGDHMLDVTGSDCMSSEPYPAVPLQEGRSDRPQAPAEQVLPDWRERAAEMARGGLTAQQIARELELPVGEVELALALRG